MGMQRGPKRKRMKRPSRLQSAKHWICSYSGKNIIKGYKNWFGVDIECAILELRMLGLALDEEYIAKILKSRDQMILARQRKRAQKKEAEDLFYDSDEEFCFIVGYTSSGFPYGTRWSELKDLE